MSGNTTSPTRPGRSPAGQLIFRLLAAAVVAHCVAQVAVIGVSMSGLRVTQALALLILLAALPSGWAFAASIVGNVGLNGEASGMTSRAGRLLAGLVLMAAPLVLACLMVAAYVVPEMCGDGFTYHIPTIHFWAAEGRICWIDPRLTNASCMNGYPKAAEALTYLMVTAFGSGHLLHSATLLFMPLGVLGISLIALHLGASARFAATSGMLYVLVPVNITQSLSTYVDAAFCSSSIALVALLVHNQRRLTDERTASPGGLLLLGGAMGLAVATKGTGLAHAAVALALFVFVLARYGGARQKSSPRAIQGVLRPVLLVMVTAFLVGGYWYARNYAIAGSPLYPAGLSVGGHDIFKGPPVADAIHADSNTPEFMRSWPMARKIAYTWLQGISEWPQSIFWLDSRTGGIGWLWVLGCVPAIIYAAARAWKTGPHSSLRQHFVLVAVFVAVVFLATPMNWWSRYTLWLYALGLPSFALALTRLFEGGRAFGARQAWAIACVLVSLLEAGYLVRQIRPNVVVIGHADGRSGPALRFRDWKPWESGLVLTDPRIRRLLSGNDAVAVGSLGDGTAHLLGHLCQPPGRRTVAALHVELGREGVDRLRRRSIRLVIWDDSRPMPPALANAVREVTHVKVAAPAGQSKKPGFGLFEVIGDKRK